MKLYKQIFRTPRSLFLMGLFVFGLSFTVNAQHAQTPLLVVDDEESTLDLALVIIDEVEVPNKIFNLIKPTAIKSFSVLKDEKSTAKYGEKGKYGVILIELKDAKEEFYKEVSSTETFYEEASSAEVSKNVSNNNKNKLVSSVSILIDKKAKKVESGIINLSSYYVVTTKSKEKKYAVHLYDEAPLLFVDGVEVSENLFRSINTTAISGTSASVGKAAIEQYGERAKYGAFEFQVVEGFSIDILGSLEPNPVVYVDGIEIKYDELSSIEPETIDSVSVLKNESATAVYGEKGKNGVIVIKLKK